MFWSVLAFAALAGGSGGSDLDRFLSLPVSPGSVALIAPYAADPRAAARLAAALRDPKSETRAAAARVAHVCFLKGLQNALEDVLAEEGDAEAAREQIRALASLGGSEEDDRLVRAASRFDGRLDADLAVALARTRGPEAISLLLANETWHLNAYQWASMAFLASRGRPEDLSRFAERALASGNGERWSALLAVVDARKGRLPEGTLVSGLQSQAADVAVKSALTLAREGVEQPFPNPEALRARVPKSPSSPDAAFAFELLGRALGAPATEDRAFLDRLATAKHSAADDIGPGSPLLSLLTATERSVIRERYNKIRAIPSDTAKRDEKRWEPERRPSASSDDHSLVLRTVFGLPRGVGSDTLAASRCELKRGGLFGLALVRYNREGRPMRVSPIDVDAPAACKAPALSLLLMTLARDDEFPILDEPDPVAAVARLDCISALDEPDVCPTVCPADEGTLRVGGDVLAPVLKDRVEPRYPESSRRARKEGTASLEAIIGTEGCVRSVRLLRGVDPLLDLEAAAAVSQWKYRPAHIADRPVAVYLSVTVTYRLTRN